MSCRDDGNDFGDFDARDNRKALPPMRTDDLLGDFDARGSRVAPSNVLGDHDLRLPSLEPQERHFVDAPQPPYPSKRLRRPVDFQMDPESYHEPTPRPLMSIQSRGPREMQQHFEDPGMSNEGMDYDARPRGRPAHPLQSQDISSDMQYDDPLSHHSTMFPRNEMNNPAFDEEDEDGMHGELPYGEHEGFFGNEDPRYDPRGRPAMTGSFRGRVNERMQPRNTRPMGGPMAGRMNPRDSRLMEGPMSGSMHPREPQYMDESQNERMYQSEGPMNQRIPQRNPRLMNAPMGERGHAREALYMENPMNERMPPRDAPFMEDSMNDQMNLSDGRGSKGLMNEKLHQQQLRGMEGPHRPLRPVEGPVKERAPHMKGPMAERMNPNTGRVMDYSMNERMDPMDGQNMEGHMYEGIQPKDSRAMGGPMNPRMPPRVARPMENPMGDCGYPGGPKAMDGSSNEYMYPRDGGNVMYPRPARPMDSSINNQQYPNAPRATDNSMNEWMQQGNTRAMERPVNERMHAVSTAYPIRKPGPRPMDGTVHEDFARYDSSPILKGSIL